MNQRVMMNLLWFMCIHRWASIPLSFAYLTVVWPLDELDSLLDFHRRRHP